MTSDLPDGRDVLRDAVREGASMTAGNRYSAAFRDWLACAVAGWETPTVRRARSVGDGLDERLIAVGAAGHVLDFDDTYAPGLMHVSAPIAPVALVLGAESDRTVGEALAAYARGFETGAALSAANHPALYDRGWHPTAVCGAVAAAVTAAVLLGLDAERERHAIRLALLRASGLRASFGSDGKSLQVGFAAAAGAGAARLAGAGAEASAGIADDAGLERSYGMRLVLESAVPAIDANWIKAYPCCLQTHSAIEAACEAREAGVALDLGAVVRVHPVSLQAASLTTVGDGLQAKFSIPYLTALAWLRGAPGLDSFDGVDDAASRLAARIVAVPDPSLMQSEARVEVDGQEVARVPAALGSPLRAMTGAQLDEKIRDLAGDRLTGVLDDPSTPIATVLEQARLGAPSPTAASARARTAPAR